MPLDSFSGWESWTDLSCESTHTPSPQLCSVGRFLLWLTSAFPPIHSHLEALFLSSDDRGEGWSLQRRVLMRVNCKKRAGLAPEFPASCFDIHPEDPNRAEQKLAPLFLSLQNFELNKPLFFVYRMPMSR